MGKRMSGYINWKRNRRGKNDLSFLDNLITHLKEAAPDHIAVTGDLVNLALEAEFYQTRVWLDRLGTGRDVSVVLGNHDCYVPGALDMARRHWGSFMQGDKDQSAGQFPYLRDRGSISIIGANSGHVSPVFHATGLFDAVQAERLADLLGKARQEGKFRVDMIHHPPFANATARHKRLIGDSRFRAVVAKAGAELVLHGHTHIDSLQWIDGPTGMVPVVGVPSASHMPPMTVNSSGRPGGRYNLFSISGTPGSWRCQMQEFGYEPGSRTVSGIASRELAVQGGQ